MKSVKPIFDELDIFLQYGLEKEKLAGCRIHTYEAGEYIIKQGLPIEFFYIILEGTAKICMNAKNGKNLLLCQYVSQGTLGEVELMSEEYIASTTVIALSEFSCIVIPLAENDNTLKTNLQFVNLMGKSLSRMLLDRSDAHMASALFSSEERLCSYLLFTQHKGIFTDPLTDVAQSIGVSYRHIFRIINKLCALNILEKTSSGIRILNWEALHDKSCSGQAFKKT